MYLNNIKKKEDNNVIIDTNIRFDDDINNSTYILNVWILSCMNNSLYY